jgi:ATP-binding cassette subfamily B protein
MIYLSQNSIEFCAATVILFAANPVFGGLILLAGLPRLIFDGRYNNELWKVETRMSETRRKFWYARYFLIEQKALLEVKLFQAVDFFVDLLGLHLARVKIEEVAVERRNLNWQLLSVVLSELVVVYIVCTLVSMQQHGILTVSEFVFFLSSVGTARLSLGSLSQNIGSQLRDGKFVRDMFELFDLEGEGAVSEKSPVDGISEIEFRNVHFAYPGTSRKVLNGINLKLYAGQTLGIVAENAVSNL